LPSIAEELYRTARVLRVFVLGKRVQLDADAVVKLALLSEPAVLAKVSSGAALL
jgi:hypothetical protein